MKLKKIVNVPIQVCSQEQKIAYNYAFSHYRSIYKSFGSDSDYADYCVDSFKRTYKTKINYDALRQAIVNGMPEYVKKPFIAGNYEQIGKCFYIS